MRDTTRMFSPRVMERKLLVVDPAGVVNQIKKVSSLLTTRVDHRRRRNVTINTFQVYIISRMILGDTKFITKDIDYTESIL